MRNISESWSSTYPSDWQKFKRMKRCFWILLIAMPALFFLLILIPPHFNLGGYVYLSIPVCFIVWLSLGLCVDAWSCPKCLKRFSKSGWSYGGLPWYIHPFDNVIMNAMDGQRIPPYLPRNMDPSVKKGVRAEYIRAHYDKPRVCNNCCLPMHPQTAVRDKSFS